MACSNRPVTAIALARAGKAASRQATTKTVPPTDFPARTVKKIREASKHDVINSSAQGPPRPQPPRQDRAASAKKASWTGNTRRDASPKTIGSEELGTSAGASTRKGRGKVHSPFTRRGGTRGTPFTSGWRPSSPMKDALQAAHSNASRDSGALQYGQVITAEGFWGLTLPMRRGAKGAERPLGRRFDCAVRHHASLRANGGPPG